MIVKTASPVSALSGSYEGCDLVYSTLNGRIQARAKVEVQNPKSAEQQLIRNFMSNSTKNWDTLTQVQRDAWQAYAEAYFTTNAKGESITPSGLATYVKANAIRQVLGLPLVTAAPLEAPPAALTSIVQVDGHDADSLGVTVNHAYAALAGYQVLVRMTPAMHTTAVKPKASDYRYVVGANAGSAAALPANGGSVVITPTRYFVNDGQRYGVEVRVVRTADGIMSRPVYGDFLKAI